MTTVHDTSTNTAEGTWIPTQADHATIARLNASARHSTLRGQDFYSIDLLTPGFQEAENVSSLPVLAHYFGGACDFFVLSMDENGTAFGYVCLGDPMCAEYGPFHLPEVEDMTSPFLIERNEHWEPRSLRELKEESQWASVLRWV